MCAIETYFWDLNINYKKMGGYNLIYFKISCAKHISFCLVTYLLCDCFVSKSMQDKTYFA